MKKGRSLLLCICTWVIIIVSQNNSYASIYGEIHKGNKAYHKGNFKEAQENYDKALKKKPGWDIPLFNKGNSLYKLNKFEDAIKEFQENTRIKGTGLLSKVYYNMGNTYYNLKDLQKAIDCYKEALRQNPGDADAKYNLELAMKKQEENQKDKDKDKNKDKDKGKDKDKDKDKDKNKDKDKDKGKDKDKDNKSQEQDIPQEISREQALRILQAFQEKEKKNMRELKGKYTTKKAMDKDW